jgi:hypothetical protein
LQAILKNGYSASSHRAVAYDDVVQEMQEKKVRPKHKLFGGAPQVVRIKWECTGTTSIFKRNYPIDYVNVDSSGRRNCQCNSVLIIQVKRAKERAATEAEVDAGQISLIGTFSQSSNASNGNPPSPPPRRKSPRLKSPPPAAGHKVDEDDDNDNNDDGDGSEFPDEDDDKEDNGGGEYSLAGNVGKCVCWLHPSNDRHFCLSPTCRKCHPDTSATFYYVGHFFGCWRRVGETCCGHTLLHVRRNQ